MVGKQWSIFYLGVILFFSLSFHSYATDKEITVTEIGEEDNAAQDVNKIEEAKDCVVQVVLQYLDENGNRYLLKSGSGFLISDTVILTNYQNVILTDEEKELASQYVSEQTGKTIKFDSEEGGQAAYQIGIVVYRDVVFAATVNTYSSKEMDLAILNITDTINRTKATLGNSDEVENNAEIYALGYKTISVMSSGETELLSQTDCREEKGVLSRIVADSHVKYMVHTCKISEGNTGGPIVDGDGNVLGMSIFRTTENETADSYRALTINEIKGLLDNCEIAYQEAGLFSVTEPVLTEEQPEEEEEIDTNLLDSYIINFNMLEQSDYTPESFSALRAALDKAREIKSDKGATQEEIDNAITQLEIAKAGLVVASKINWPFIIVTIILAIVLLGALIIYILYLKGVIGNKNQRESLQTLQDMTNRSKENLNGQGAYPHPMPSKRGAVSNPLNNRVNNINGEMGTTVLNNAYAQSEGTTVLGISGSRGNAYITRVKTSEKICIDRNEFIIGKEIATTNYCIRDNSSVSREHAKIIRSGSIYYLIDLNSTNCTYLNGMPLVPGEQMELENGNIIQFSDEEFIFSEA